MPGIASAATAVVIGHVAGGTSTIRVGAGGVMLPNHAPLVVAEQFGTLEALYPGRIDLGLGRAPGTDQITSYRPSPHPHQRPERLPPRRTRAAGLLSRSGAGRRVHAVPGSGLEVPIWILGSSLFGAQLAAALGLPYAFASHFAPGAMMEAIEVYRAQFQPSEQLSASYVMLGFNVFAADSDHEAKFLQSSAQQSILSLRRGRPGRVPPPVENFESRLTATERLMLQEAHRCSVSGSVETVRAGLDAFIERTGADEIMVSCQMFDHAARRRSFEIAATAGMAAPKREQAHG